MPTWEQLQARVETQLVRPTWVVRPAPSPPPQDEDEDDDESGSEDDGEKISKKKPPLPPYLRKEVMLPVFSKLAPNDLLVVMRVCRSWASWSIHPSLWKKISLAGRHITESHLEGLVRRQPVALILDWSLISYDQFLWLLCRMPQLQALHCEGISWGVVRSLVSPYCPALSELNLSFCEGVDDDALSALLRAPHFSRPGFRDASSRLRQLTCLRLAGTSVGDPSVALIARSLPFLTHLDLSECTRLTNLTPDLLSHSTSLVCHSLKHLDLRGCHGLTPWALPSLGRLPLLSYLALDPCESIPFKAIKVWGTTHGYSFDDQGIMRRIPSAIDDDTTAAGDLDPEVESTPLPQVSDTASEKEEPKLKSCTTTDSKTDGESVDKITSRKRISKEGKEDNQLSDRTQSKAKVKGKHLEVKVEKKESFSEEPVSSVIVKSAAEPKRTLSSDSENQLQKSAGTSLENIQKSEEKAKPLEEAEAESPKSLKSRISVSTNVDDLDDRSSSSDACRRSERRNKGKKYKLNMAKCSSKKRLLQKNKRTLLDTRVSDKECPKASRKEIPHKEKPIKTSRENLKIIRKNSVVTRGKKLGASETTESKAEYEITKKNPAKIDKDSRTSRDSKGEFKVLISLKPGGPRYSSKLRKKLQESEHSSPSEKVDDKNQKNGSDLPSSAQKAKLEGEGKTSSAVTDKFQKRKERTGSTSSSSSSSPSSPRISLPKKIKVEVEPLPKFNRRKSDCHKHSGASASPGGSKVVPESSEKPLSKERPERPHRSPRRLSLSQ